MDYLSFQCGERVKRPIDAKLSNPGGVIPGDNYAGGDVDAGVSWANPPLALGPPLPPVQQIATQW
jgi:hypothetical protein